MEFTYIEPKEHSIDIDFNKVYEKVSQGCSDNQFIYEEFCDNFDYYLKELYNIEIDYEYNLMFYSELADAWEEFMETKQ